MNTTDLQPLKLIKKDSSGTSHYECPLCSSDLKIPSNRFYGVCPACHCTVMNYRPAPHQMKFHQSKAQYKLNIGGYGSGKTTMCCAELARHVLETPYGKSLITAPKLQQVRDAVIPELDKFLPEHLIEIKTKSPNMYYKMTNGHEILIYASNDEQNIRSLNLTAFYIEEASNVDLTVFNQLQGRLRNEAGIIYDEYGLESDYKYVGLVSTNPDDGWVRTNFLLLSGKLFASESIDRNMYDKVRSKNGDPNYHSFLSSSRDNNYLPKVFIERLIIGKTPQWVRKYIDCYLDIKEGAVYKEIANQFCQPFPIPNHWLRIAGFDKGYRDETALLVGAIDPVTGIIYCYDEYYEAEQPVTYHANQIHKYVDGYKFFNPIQADPTVKNRNERDGESYQSYFYRVSNGIFLYPGNNDLDAGINKVRDYIHLDKIRFFETLVNTKDEGINYVYKENEDKPVDAHNHLMDALRYMVAPLPQNPADLNTSLLMQRDLVKNFWAEGWEKTEDDIITGGGVTMLKGGFNYYDDED